MPITLPDKNLYRLMAEKCVELTKKCVELTEKCVELMEKCVELKIFQLS